MDNNYLYCIYIQYCNSINKKCDIKDIFNDSDFIKWIFLNNKQIEVYKNYLKYLGVDFNGTIAELNKGKYDSVLKDDGIIISPFADTLEKNNSELFFIQDKPIVIVHSSIIGVENIDMFVTSNPYSLKYMRGMDKLHNNDYDIILGMFGGIKDKDKNKKLQEIKEFEEKLSREYDLEYETFQDTYMCVLKSKNKVKKLIKTI